MWQGRLAVDVQRVLANASLEFMTETAVGTLTLAKSNQTHRSTGEHDHRRIDETVKSHKTNSTSYGNENLNKPYGSFKSSSHDHRHSKARNR